MDDPKENEKIGDKKVSPCPYYRERISMIISPRQAYLFYPDVPGSPAPPNMPPSCTSTKLVYSVQGLWTLCSSTRWCYVPSVGHLAVADPCAAQFPESVCQHTKNLPSSQPSQRRTKMSAVSLAFGSPSLYLPARQLECLPSN